MFNNFFRKFKKGFSHTSFVSRQYDAINPEDIFLDSANLPGFDEHHMEGRIERPMGDTSFLMVKAVLVLIVLLLGGRLYTLGVMRGDAYREISENNRLEQTLIFANRGVIYDRNQVELATNDIKEDGEEYPERLYAPLEGLSHVVGYLNYPSRDNNGFYYDVNYRGRDGVELLFEDVLSAENGLKLTETNALGGVVSESVVEHPVDGAPVTLSVDARVTDVLHKAIRGLAESNGFVGGAGVIMDTRTGELIALTSYPEYDQNLLTSGSDSSAITKLLNSSSKPFLNRVIGGLYTPGSTLKPIIALAALHEGIISPYKEIYSSGSITVPNPYDPDNPSIFKDWKAHGWTAMAEAIAVSSDVYFYSIGGGFGDQKGLGIGKIDEYLELFGLGEKTGIVLPGELSGIIPSPEWKKEKFNGDIWRLGDTYITAIGQYGTQVTPLELVRAISAIANRGTLLTPSLLLGGSDSSEKSLSFPDAEWDIVHKGMREAVTYGSSLGLNVPYVNVAAKTGTAEVGSAKKYVNSWSTGFFPYSNPHYAFAVVMEKGPSNNTTGATYVTRQVLDWMALNATEYFQ